jgi:Iron-binding zinc finger CDGSH type
MSEVTTPTRTYTASSGRAAAVERFDGATITVYPDGPALVRGRFRLQDELGNEVETDRATIALCRCGKSRLHPICDGTHKALPAELRPN